MDAAPWPKVRLGEICDSISDGDHLPPPKSNEGIPFITISDIGKEGEIDFSNCYHVPCRYYDKIDEKRKPRQGDILYTVVGSFGKAKLVGNEREFCFQRHIAILRPNYRKIDSHYLYSQMRSQAFFAQADAFAIGVAQRTISLSALRRMTIPLPSLPVQRAIAKRLSAYDDLIENNKKRIAILERMAEQLYKEWFVRRRKSVEKASKESWCNYSIKELCYINHDTISAKASGSILYLDTSSITGNKIATLELYDLRSAPGRARRKVKRNSIVYSIVRPNLKHHGIIKDAPANLIVSTGFAVLDAKHDIANVIYLFLSSQEVVDYCQMIAEGAVATYPSIRPEDIGKLKMSLPSIAEAEKWNRELEPLFTLASNLQRQNALLAKERDLLLPRLMSGKMAAAESLPTGQEVKS